jgi:hypothetical protein
MSAPTIEEIKAFEDGFRAGKKVTAELDPNQEYLNRSKLQVPPNKISSANAHQVAMEAAYAVHQCAIHRGDIQYDDIGTKCAKAYLQAYEAVEGWTKPELRKDNPPLHDPAHPDFQKNFGRPTATQNNWGHAEFKKTLQEEYAKADERLDAMLSAALQPKDA